MYVSAEKLRDIQAKNHDIDATYGYIEEFSSFSSGPSTLAGNTNPSTCTNSIVQLYEEKSASSHARRLLVDSCAEFDRED
jgi:hypothetical protein